MFGRPLRALIVGVAAAALAGGIAATGLLDRLEATTVDQRFDVRGSQGAPDDVVVVGIDAATLDRRGFPFPRSLHADAIRNLLAAGARRVVYDVQFSSRSAPREDRALADAVSDRRVTLGTAELTSSGTPLVLPELRRVAAGRIGHVLFPSDDDGTWRDVEGELAGLPSVAVLGAGGDPGIGRRPVDFAGPALTVPEIPFGDVLTGRFDPQDVRGKVVVVGATALDLQDFHDTSTGTMTGAEVIANAIQTVLDGYPLRDAPPVAAVLLVLAAGLLAPLAAAVPGPPTRALILALGAGLGGAAALLVGAQLAFDGGTIVPVVTPLLALLFGTAGAVALTYAVELRARRRLRTEFERFVAPSVARELLQLGDADAGGDAARAGTGAARPSGLASRRLEATVLFCDLRGFTSLAEGLEAEQVIAVLNRYLTLVSGEVLDRGGTVVSYQGDGMMAVFGAPLPQDDHAARALAAARAILDDALPRFNTWLLEERLADAPLAAGIGLNSGPVMSGIVGSERRVEYAAVGDATNVAARLQALGRDLDGRLFVSASTVAALDGAADDAVAAAQLRLHGEVALKGRREPVTVWIGD